jgi:hypothetical protein
VLGVLLKLFALTLWCGLEWASHLRDRTPGLNPTESSIEPANPISIVSRAKQCC